MSRRMIFFSADTVLCLNTHKVQCVFKASKFAAGPIIRDTSFVWGDGFGLRARILTRGDETLLQSSFYAFEMFSKRRRGVSLRPIMEGPTYVGETHGEVSLVDASAIIDGDRLHVFATNRHTENETEVRIVLLDRSITDIESGDILTGPGAKAANTFEEPHLVKTTSLSEAGVDTKSMGDEAYLWLPPLSVAAVTYQL